jgi:hypothetical protein
MGGVGLLRHAFCDGVGVDRLQIWPVMPHKAYIADDCSFEERLASQTVVITESDEKLTDTGLLDAGGNKLYRLKAPIGFVKYGPQ